LVTGHELTAPEHLPLTTKAELARVICDRIEDLLTRGGRAHTVT
jgi:hypothetical protein